MDSTHTGTPETGGELRLLLESLTRALEERNLEAVMALFMPDDDLLMIGARAGETARGRQALEELFGRIFARPERYAWRWTTVVSAAAAEADAERTAWLFAEGEALVTGAGPERRVPYRVAGFFERSAEGWRWRVFYGSVPLGTS